MTKLQDFRIEFDKVGATYAPGQTVTGKVIIKLSKPKNVKEIRFEGLGEAEVHWTKSRNVKDSSGRSHHHTDHYKGTEHYFNISNRLVGAAPGDGHTTLTPGEHTYHFSFQLPLNIPCSIEHTFGHVRYTAKAVLDRPWRFDHKVIKAFTVVAPYDLNTKEHLKKGINDDIKRKFFTCCMFNMGDITLNVKSRVSGYAPGETIDLIISHDNSSNHVDLKKMKLKLQKSLEFYATSPSADKKFSTETVNDTKQAGSFNKKGETKLVIQVPPMPPSNLENCSLIKISYNLVLTINVTGLHFKTTKTYPIEIGTVPLYYQSNNLNATTPYVPSAPSVDQVNPNVLPVPQNNQSIGFVVMSIPPYLPSTPQSAPTTARPTEMPPPSYEESFSGSNNIVNQNEQGMHGTNVQFAPRYPVYKLPMPMPYSS